MTNVKTMGDLTALTEHVIEQAKRRAEQIISRAQKEAERIISAAEERAKQREEELVRAKMDEVERVRKQIVSQAQLRLKEELLREKAEILGRIVGEIRDRLERMCAQDGKEYLNVLVGLVETALAGEETPKRVVLHLSPQDCSRYEKELPHVLAEKLGIKDVKLVTDKIHGGLILEFPDKHLEIDSSLAQLLREFTPKVEEMVEREIFTPLDEEKRDDSAKK